MIKMCLTETYSKVRTDKQLSDSFAIFSKTAETLFWLNFGNLYTLPKYRTEVRSLGQRSSTWGASNQGICENILRGM
jgi:hypothetical protein